MAETKTYTGVFEYDADDEVWLVRLADEPGVHTFGRTLTAARAHLAEAIAAWFDLDPADVVIVPDLTSSADPAGD